MARIRTVKPEFWSHPVMTGLPDDARLAAIGLLNLADDEGYFLAASGLIRSFLWPLTESSVKAHGVITTLISVGWIEVRKHPTHGDIGRVVNFSKHQIINRPSPSRIKAYWLTEYSVKAHGVITEGSLPEQGTGNREQGTGNRGGDLVAKAPKNTNSELFDAFWEAYQKKTGKVEAIKAWGRLSDEDRQAAADGAAGYAIANPDPKYRKDPVRYLTGRRWEDEGMTTTMEPPSIDHGPIPEMKFL